jgi:hypothetical protein
LGGGSARKGRVATWSGRSNSGPVKGRVKRGGGEEQQWLLQSYNATGNKGMRARWGMEM